MTANRFAVSVSAPLLAGGLLFLSAGCGFDGENDEWVVGGDSAKQASGSTASSTQSSGQSTSTTQKPATTSTTGGSSATTTSTSTTSGSTSTSSSTTSGGTTSTPESAGAGTDTPSSSSSSSDPETPAVGGVDTIPFSALKWSYGHFGGSRAQLSSPQLANLKCSGNTLSYKWVQGLSGWGLSNGEAGAIAAAFVQKADGSWIGGKFDWVSTSRSSRGLENVLAGYEGWNLTGIPNPCQICFVVVDVSGRRRSNVVGPATWSR